MNKIIVKPLAAERLIEVAGWYEKQRSGLGLEFLDEWEMVAEYIVHYPESCERKYKNFRQARFKRFPYLVIYEIETNHVVVYNVIFAKRDPRRRYKKT